jgi:hypothetical protein
MIIWKGGWSSSRRDHYLWWGKWIGLPSTNTVNRRDKDTVKTKIEANVWSFIEHLLKTKIEANVWSFIEHISNPWLWWWRKSNKKMKQLLCQRWSCSAWSEQRGSIDNCQSAGSPIGNQSSLGLMTCSGATDDTSIFTWYGGPLKMKDQSDRTTIKMMGPTCNVWRVRS